MADFECLRILRQGAQAWNVWRGLSGYVKVDLVQADLARMDLRGVNQEGFDVTGASIEGTLFTDAHRDEGVVKDCRRWNPRPNHCENGCAPG